MRAVATKPVTALKRHATEILAELEEERRPLLITEHGRSAAVMLDVASYQGLLDRMALLEGIARGERAILEGRVVSHAAAKQRLRRWLPRSR
jgi:prevent-host-death family protein